MEAKQSYRVTVRIVAEGQSEASIRRAVKRMLIESLRMDGMESAIVSDVLGEPIRPRSSGFQ